MPLATFTAIVEVDIFSLYFFMTYRQRPAEQPFFIRATQVDHDKSFTHLDIGSMSWWQSVKDKGTPLLFERNDGDYDVFFIVKLSHFGPQLSEIYIQVNGITDHHKVDLDQFIFIRDCDLAYFHCVIPPKWLGSYTFYPQQQTREKPTSNDLTQLMPWLKQVFSDPHADNFNHSSLSACPWGQKRSPLAMPCAPVQLYWQALDSNVDAISQSPAIEPYLWHCKRLNNQRRVWFYTPAVTSTATMPIVLLQDGHFWAEEMPIWAVIDDLTGRGELAPAHYVLIDSIDTYHRSRDLPCNEHYWHAIFDELLPELERYYQCELINQPFITAGQSFGGLSSLYAALLYPDKVVAVLSQSGSFWWPDRKQVHQQGSQINSKHYLVEQIEKYSLPSSLLCHLDIGSLEGNMPALTQTVHAALLAKGVRSHYRQYLGGHEWLCWRECLIAGLVDVLKPYRFNLS
ncbi:MULTISPECIES: enterochelin esterase [unclassified Vibrio]|uniref:Enterochelin esterase n=1 Tax=Vibrio sp. HB236076 TaxID=3232307 RepID=A0AB39HDK5_9VIBR|nr:enterochelin esterase [Vibrio sp. HB161653]MDP5255102.1 enterochelin esterase [Vibrio sp. HB161653]